ncbi:hypothetical protein NHQ30_002734 [Ciborinia camelliae]|nr:hypothetical protein NHQ30_002734 [Ciborinia camelliae]
MGLESFVKISSSTGSNQSLKLAAEWLAGCIDGHLACQSKISSKSNFFPTRLIDIGVEGSMQTPRLCLRKYIQSNSVYFTLSHCWGAVLPQLVLLQSNIQSLCEGINICQLSNTFQDALSVVQSLGGRYIWIDSLCIIQDSRDDWLVESARMCDIYANSHCNICATDAKDGSEGIFRDRKPLQVQQGWWNPIGVGTSQLHCVFNPNFWTYDVSNSALYSRAWACQECLLSKRNLHFGHKQLFWECRQQQASETFPMGFPKIISQSNLKNELLEVINSPQKHQVREVLRTRDVWGKVVRSYTGGDLTYQTDKLVAIAGLAAAVHQSIGGKYLAGIWENHLPSGLVWARATSIKPFNSVLSIAPTQPQTFTAPSWSWASLKSEVEIFPIVNGDIEELCQILEANVDLASDNPYGQVCGGYIKLKGNLSQAECKDKRLSVLIDSDQAVYQLLEDRYIFWDYKDITALEGIACLYLVPIYKNRLDNGDVRVDGLIIYQTGHKYWEFRRCGAFVLFENHCPMGFKSVCNSFRKFSEEDKSSEIGLDGDGKVVITIL